MATPISEVIDFVQREIRADRTVGRHLFLALSPLDAQRIGELNLVGWAKPICCNRPAVHPILNAFEETAAKYGVNLQLNAHVRTWLTKIAESQNIPGPLSTIGSRLVNSKTLTAYAQQCSPLEFGGDLGLARFYEHTPGLAKRIAPTWGQALGCTEADERHYKIQRQRSKEKIRSANTQFTVMCGWPGSGRLAFAQKIWLASVNARERFGYIDLCDRASRGGRFSEAKQDALRSLLRNKSTTVYLDLTSYPGPDSCANDAVVSTLESWYPLDLLWISGAFARSVGGRRLFGPATRVTPTWIQLQDIPKALGPAENYYGESLTIRELCRDWGMPGNSDPLRLGGFSRSEPFGHAATGNLRVLVASDFTRVKAFVECLARNTGRPVLHIGLSDLEVDPTVVRKFTLRHRLGIILISDLLQAPLEILHTSDVTDGIRLRISEERLDCAFTRRLNDYSSSNIWSPGIEPILDSRQLAGLWVFGMLPLPASVAPDEFLLNAKDEIDVEALIAVFAGSAQGRVRTLFKHWNYFQYLPKQSESVNAYGKVEYTGAIHTEPAVADPLPQSP